MLVCLGACVTVCALVRAGVRLRVEARRGAAAHGVRPVDCPSALQRWVQDLSGAANHSDPLLRAGRFDRPLAVRGERGPSTIASCPATQRSQRGLRASGSLQVLDQRHSHKPEMSSR